MISPFVIVLSLIVILSGIFLIFKSAKIRHMENIGKKANIYLGLGIASLCLGGVKLVLEVL